MTHVTENTRALTGSSLLEAPLQTSSDAIVVSDAEGRIVFWNPGATRIFGFDAVGQSLDLIIPEKLRARHWQGYRHVIPGSVCFDHRSISVPRGRIRQCGMRPQVRTY
jgi:PAS domain S-box-containing protein